MAENTTVAMSLEDLQNELVVLGPKTYKQDGLPRSGATAEDVARCEELNQLIEAEEEYMKSDDEAPPTADAAPTEDTRTDAQKIADLTEANRRLQVTVNAYKAPKGVGTAHPFKPDGEKVRIDEAMLPSLAEAERLPISIPEALKEDLIDEAKALLMNKAVERRIRCYVKKAGFHKDDRTQKTTSWDGGFRKGLTDEQMEKACFWLTKIGRMKTDPDDAKKMVVNPIWDTTIVIPNM